MNMMESNNTPDLEVIFGGADKLSVDQHDKFESSFGVMDEGVYAFEIERAQLKKTKDYANNGGGMYISIMFRRLEGSNQVYWNNYNVKNQDEQVADRAKSEIATIVSCSGETDIPAQADGLVGLQLGIQVGKKQTKESLKAQKVNPMTAAKDFENFVVKYLGLKDVPEVKEAEAPVDSGSPATATATATPTRKQAGGANLPTFNN